ncbi:FCD domain-containing protein [Devosia algicola]|uniref:FCD domain-containing protein n=1 Tax=Devosia algicola TaxID=3026418 RepID=A0ABY7YT00_9HYPH|nr:FCD domain-containing protein [Devosia algicola]WDR03975.1 FCD domain-containing protein [Devosia algicola]
MFRAMNRDVAPAETGAAVIARQLASAILRGEYPPESILPGEIELATKFSASRTSVREALKSLSAKGLIQSRKKAGTSVRPRADWQMLDRDLLALRLEIGPEHSFATDLLALRQAIEPAAAAAAAQHQDKAAIAVIAAAFAEMEAATHDRTRFVDPDLRFHKAILAASGNEFMMAFGAMIEAGLAAFITISLRHSGAPAPSVPLHHNILKAIEAADPEAARTAMETLLSRTKSNISQDHA